MEPIKDFEWNDLILTAKGWYESTGDLTEDFAIAIENNDNRSILFNNKKDTAYVASVLMNVVMPSLWRALPKEVLYNRCWLSRSDDFYNEVMNKMRLYELDFHHAVLFAVHNVLCNCIERKYITLNKPVYGKGRRRMKSHNSKNPKSMTYMEMNRIASKMFDRTENDK